MNCSGRDCSPHMVHLSMKESAALHELLLHFQRLATVLLVQASNRLGQMGARLSLCCIHSYSIVVRSLHPAQRRACLYVRAARLWRGSSWLSRKHWAHHLDQRVPAQPMNCLHHHRYLRQSCIPQDSGLIAWRSVQAVQLITCVIKPGPPTV